MVQIATTRAQRTDRMTRLNQLQAELEFLERLHALEGKVGGQNETADSRTDLAIGYSQSNLWDQYNKVSELAPSAVAGDEQTPSQQLSFLRRAFLPYNPHTSLGWIWHTLFYTGAILFVWLLFAGIVLVTTPGIGIQGLLGAGIIAIPLGIALFIIQRRVRRNAVRSAAQPEVPNA